MSKRPLNLTCCQLKCLVSGGDISYHYINKLYSPSIRAIQKLLQQNLAPFFEHFVFPPGGATGKKTPLLLEDVQDVAANWEDAISMVWTPSIITRSTKDQTIILGLHICLDHRSLRSKGQKTLMILPPLPHPPLFRS